jgi:hypothetical protein
MHGFQELDASCAIGYGGLSGGSPEKMRERLSTRHGTRQTKAQAPLRP